jgi:hypothetical protein
MTNTLIRFLDATARHFLHRCVFVVTAMEKRDEEERNNIINFVRFELEDKLNLCNPVVLQSSAITMIPIKNIPLSMQDSWEYWQDQFKQLEVTIRQKMVHQRGLIVSEHLIRLLQELNKDMNIELEEKRREYTNEETILKQSSVESIEKVLGTLYDQSAERIAKDISSVKSYVDSEKNSFCSAAKAEVTSILNSNIRLDTKNYDTQVVPKIKTIRGPRHPQGYRSNRSKFILPNFGSFCSHHFGGL